MPEFRHVPRAPTTRRWLARGGVIDEHRHEEQQLVYAGRGVVAVTTDHGSWVAPGTQAIWIPAGTVHAHHARGELELHLVGLAEDPLRLDRPTALAVSPLLRELILALTRHRDPDSAEHDRLRSVLADQLLAAGRAPLHVPEPTDAVLRRACAILHADPGDGRSLAELAQSVHVSERTLSRLFHSDLGLTFPQWRTQLRLSHALVLLADGAPVTTVAHQCGWSSASAFIDVFRRTFGHTPGRGPAPE